MNVVRRWLADEKGQDLVEYVLLGSTLALAGLAALTAFPGIINAVYSSWEAATMSIWYPPNPAS
jgi:Flp pilus assembly pilin Flp